MSFNTINNETMIGMQCTFNDEKFANVAMEEANKSDLLSQHGCVAVINGKVMARGHNSSRCYSADGFLRKTCSCHAEVDVLRKLFHIYKPEMYEINNSKSRSSRRKKRTTSRRSDSSSSVFNLYDERSCFLSKKRKLVCGT
jgi:hypothetical protein